MNRTLAPSAGNPFSTRRTRPGALPYLFEDGQSAGLLVDQLRILGWRGQIVGPHGAGKSTLLHALRQELESQSLCVRHVTLRNGGQGIDELWRSLAAAAGQSAATRNGAINQASVLLLDGGEQLGWLAWRRLLWQCRRRNLGLIVTAHRDLGLPTLSRLQPTLATVQLVADELLSGHVARITSKDIAEAYDRHPGDIRETLFALYDLHEKRVRAGANEPGAA